MRRNTDKTGPLGPNYPQPMIDAQPVTGKRRHRPHLPSSDMAPVALDKPRYPTATTMLAAGGLAIVLLALVIAVVTVSDESTQPALTRPAAGAPSQPPPVAAPTLSAAPRTAVDAPPTATAAPRLPHPTDTAATEAPSEVDQVDGPQWRRYWLFPRLRPDRDWAGGFGYR
jgi:hypothetical protein